MRILLVFQILIAIGLSSLVVLQVKGNGFGRVWGSVSNSLSRRGLEKLVFKFTFVLTGLFVLLSILTLFV